MDGLLVDSSECEMVGTKDAQLAEMMASKSESLSVNCWAELKDVASVVRLAMKWAEKSVPWLA